MTDYFFPAPLKEKQVRCTTCKKPMVRRRKDKRMRCHECRNSRMLKNYHRKYAASRRKKSCKK